MKKSSISILSSIALISLFVVCGCVIVKKSVRQFSHNAHTAEGVTCKACHMSVLKADKAGMPNEKNCVFCHETVYDEIPVAEIYTRDNWQSTRGEELTLFNEVKFSHKTHIDKEVKCVDCHNNIALSVNVTKEHLPNANTCVKCHSEWLNKPLCSKCHIEIRFDIPPENHKRSDFIQVHGKSLKDKPFENWQELTGRHSQQCFQCHKQEYCIKCHQDVPPRNHTNQWRLIGHGVQAGINRDSCNACHRSDFCVRCHENTRPRSHVANWGASRSRHCTYCHEPLSSNNCFVCHKDTPSHKDAPNAPIFVRKNWPCRACHPILVPLDHFDNGDKCENCHKATRPSGKTSRRIGRLRDRLGR